MTEKEMLTASCDNSEPSTIISAEHESKGNAHDAKLTKGESSLDVLNFSTNHAMIEQILVEPSLDFLCHKMICLMFLVTKMTCMMIFMLYPCNH